MLEDPPKMQPQSISEKRREARRLRDPHHAQPFKRYFIGPTPVPSTSASSTAQAIAEDVKILKPTSIGVVDQEGNLITSRRPSQGSVNEEITRVATTVPLDSTPTKSRRNLSPLRIPRRNMLSPFSAADRDRRHLSRDASFTSAKSMPDSVLGEGELPINNGQAEGQQIRKKKSIKSETSAMVDFSFQDASSFATPVKKKRGESQSSLEPMRDLGRKKLSFEVMSLRDRRGRSEESPAPGGSILQKRGSTRSNTYDIEMPAAKQLTEEPLSINRTPTKDKQWHNLHPLRTMTSHRSIGQASRSSIGSPSTPVVAGKKGPRTPNTKMSDAPVSIMTDADTSIGFDTGPSARLQRLRDRARKRYGQATIGQGQMPSRTLTQQSQYSHGRDMSRQSRMSRASTAGTFASIATRFTEGSFGATGGVRSKVVKKLGGNNSKFILARARDIKVEHLRHGHTMSSKGGVLPGTVGTSAGGTKWVGQTFEVGKRFWQVLESREEELRGDTIDEEALEEEELDIADKRALEAASIRRAVEIQHARQVALSRSPEAVIDSFAREAKDATEEHHEEMKKSGEQTPEWYDAQQLPAVSTIDHRNESVRPQMGEGKSKAPLSHKRQTLKAEIESRQGWNDVISFMSAKNTFRSSERGERPSKKEGLLNDSRSHNLESKAVQQDKQNGVIPEASSKGATEVELTDNRKPVMTSQEALSHPDSPEGVEERFPQAIHELLRRQSNPGIQPSGKRDDAASDHQVAAGLISDSPSLLTPPDFLSQDKWNETTSNELTGLRSNSTSSLERKPVTTPPTSSTPLLKKRASAIGIMTSAPKEKQAGEWSNKPSILREVGFDATLQKKSVQFQGSNTLTPPTNRFGSAFLRSSPTKELDGRILLGGRARNVIMGDSAPAPPEEVLSRNATPDLLSPPLVHSLVSSPAADARPEDLITTRSILRRDRMLVRLAWSPSDNLPKHFSERDSRKYPMYSEPFKEYMVVYRLGRLELWEDTSIISKCLGHGDQLKLSVAVTLKRGKTFISTYSYIDRIFCLTFTRDDETHHRLPHLRRSGTKIWFFDTRSITVGADWMWDLWRDLGGTIPQHLDVHLPAFSVRVRIPIPEEITPKDTASMDSKSVDYFEGGEGFKIMTPNYVKKVVRKVIEVQPEWGQLCQGVEKSGMQFELAWRSGPTLNWVKEARTVDGQRRDWAVLVGSIISEPQRPSMLEYRPAFHYPTQVRTAKGETLKEPPGIEGFLWRVKAVSGALTRLYTSTHDGLIFVNRSSKAFPPDRHLASLASDTGHTINNQSKYATSVGFDEIGQDRRRKRDAVRGRKRNPHREESLAELRSQVMATLVEPPTTEEEMDAQIEAYKSFERRRQFEQISNCDGYVDMRDMVLVRSLEDAGPSQNEVKHEGEELNGHAQANHNGSVESISEVEEEDLGGEEGLALAKDRVTMKRSRQFEVILSNGRSIRFEAYSNSVAKEWIERMTELSTYWKRREKVDAMELMTASGVSPDLVGKRTNNEREHRAMDHSTEGEQLSAVLGNLWHWCLHHSCRGILRSGRLFEKKKAFSGFYSRYFILIAGRLIHFKLMTSTSTARARQNQGIFHKRQETVVHLRDAYIYSGQLSEDMLVNGRSEGAGSINTFGSGTGGSANANTRHTLPRVYGDGLISFDNDEDCTFVLRYCPQRLNQAADPAVKVGFEDFPSTNQTTTPASACFIPKLGDATYNNLILRARSKLERDLWVRAINIERERLNRLDREREEKIRNQGETPWKSSGHHY